MEVDALKSGHAVVDDGASDDRLAGVRDDLAAELAPTVAAEAWHQDDLVGDDSVGPIQEELERRTDILQAAYPFRLNGGTLVYDPARRSPLYEFLLAASSLPLGGGRHVQLPRTFERVATSLIEAYFGRNAKSLHFGSPRAGNTSFRDAAAELRRRSEEWVWGPDEGLDEGTERDVKDEGCDFVVWLDHADGRKIGQLFVLGQCACGNNWQDKYNDLNVKRLQRWFKAPPVVDPVTSFATPRHVTDALLREASREAGLFFDRARLVLVAQSTEALDDETTVEMERLTELAWSS